MIEQRHRAQNTRPGSGNQTRSLANGRKNPLTEDLNLFDSVKGQIIGNGRVGCALLLADGHARFIEIIENRIKGTNSISETDFRLLIKMLDFEACVPRIICCFKNALLSKGTAVKKRAIEGLRIAAEKGLDITKAVPSLANALDDRDGDVKKNAGIALLYAAKNGLDIGAAVLRLPALLDAEDQQLSENALLTLKHAVSGKTDPQILLYTFSETLGSSNDAVRKSILAILEECVKKGWDISQIITTLLYLVEGDDERVRSDVYEFLGRIKNDAPERIAPAIAKISAGFQSPKKEARQMAASVCRGMSCAGFDLSPALPDLFYALCDCTLSVRKNAASCLKRMAIKESEKLAVHIVSAMLRFMNSDRFMAEAEANSVKYTYAARACDAIIKRLRQKKRLIDQQA